MPLVFILLCWPPCVIDIVPFASISDSRSVLSPSRFTFTLPCAEITSTRVFWLLAFILLFKFARVSPLQPSRCKPVHRYPSAGIQCAVWMSSGAEDISHFFLPCHQKGCIQTRVHTDAFVEHQRVVFSNVGFLCRIAWEECCCYVTEILHNLLLIGSSED